ncbi:hypothetical protein [Bordetella genomosp. 13]|uniref:hypothetical protein n=1 Tax=Bordetella genomosp. 13 TaxID=463040 RepID=UPI0011A834FD|nr:hypothetical protein [Bordetella genomosp. 13]
MIKITQGVVMSDELERQLMVQAMQEQFRPHPLRALLAGLRKLMARAEQPAPVKTAAASA